MSGVQYTVLAYAVAGGLMWGYAIRLWCASRSNRAGRANGERQ